MITGIIKVEEVLSAEPKAEADSSNQDLDFSGYHKKNEPDNCFIIHCFEENKANTASHGIQFDIAL